MTTAADVGLGNVDNTSDVNKPVSTAQAAALALKVDTAAFSSFGAGLVSQTNQTNAQTYLGLGNIAYLSAPTSGNAAPNQLVIGTDTRLSDARTPLAHTQDFSTLTNVPTTLAGYGITDGTSATNLANTSSGSNGAGLVGFNYSLTYLAGSIGAWLKNLANSAGSSLVGWIQSGTGAVIRTSQDKLRERVSVKDFGAIGDGTTDDTAAIQAAVTATAKGCILFFPPGKYKLTNEIRISQPIVIVGAGPGQFLEGYDTTDNGSYVIQTNTTKVAFRLVAALGNYAFGQYAIAGVHFQDICVQGVSGSSLIVACIAVDTTINSGNFHIRGNSTTRCNFRYATDALNFTGIAYLNHFYQTNFVLSNCGVRIARGSASDSGGQTRFFGCQLEFCNIGASLNEDTVNGVFSFFGCTIADNTSNGISTNDEVSLDLSGNNFENNTTAGIYVQIPAAKANSNSGHFRNIQGNEFFSNGADIWFDKQSTSGSDGNFSFPTFINSNSFQSTLALKLTVPSGQPGFCCPNFTLGANNTGTNNGQLTSSQISPSMFWGTDSRTRKYTLRYVFTSSYVSGAVVAMLPTGLAVSQVRILLTANSTSASTFNLGDIANSSRYASFSAQSQTLNTWIIWANQVPDLVIDASNNQFRLIGTGGISGAAGVIEVEGMVTY